jgi:glutamate synthase (ferredoxin)
MWIVYFLAGFLAVVCVYDLTQRRRAILRNFPLLGHLRYLLESFGPELRQYIVTDNNEERPFSRAERRWVYASAKKENNYFGFGTECDLESSPHHLIIKHQTLVRPNLPAASADGLYRLPCAKVLGGPRRRRRAFRPASIVNTSAMSYGSLSAPAVEAINRGAKLAGCWQNTGEGGISPHHLHGGDIVWQLGTGYFGCRDERGHFDLQRFTDAVAAHPAIRAIEVKLSQGAKPGLGGVLPGIKVTPEIAAIRGVPAGRDCVSPPGHTAFRDADSLLDFVEHLADVSGLPVGIKSAVGETRFWQELVELMARTGRGVDFVTIDGGEGGTGAAPLTFTDHVALPFKLGFVRVYRCFVDAGLADDVVFAGSGKLGFPESALLALALGCDLINVAREAMLSIGCIQAQRCHTGHCPTGVATQSAWLMRGLDPTHKAARFANYVVTLRKELTLLAHACGQVHPGLVSSEHFEIVGADFSSRSPAEVFGYPAHQGLPAERDQAAIRAIMEGEPDPMGTGIEPAPALPTAAAAAGSGSRAAARPNA